MNFYIYLAIAVNFIWGLAFLVPYYLKDVNPLVIVFGRYSVYGIISSVLFMCGRHYWGSLNKKNWQKALLFAFAGNIGYYLALTLAIHYAGIAMVALIIGTLPITMAVYGNWVNKEFSFRNIVMPISFILFGMCLLNWFQYAHIPIARNSVELILGSLFAVIALLLWTWYGVANASYMKQHPTISSHTWSIAVGVSCFIQTIFILPLLIVMNNGYALITIQNRYQWMQVIIGSLILGVLVSWLSAIGWNKVSRHLPTTLAAQLIVFETISSLFYGFLLDQRMPQPIFLLSILIILMGVILGIRAIHSSQIKISQTEVME